MKIKRWLSAGVLLAVSGGADSVALLRLFEENRRFGESLAVAHVNHGLRGEESDQDARFVRELAVRFSLPYFEHKIALHDWTLDKTGSRESAARNLRYGFLLDTAKCHGLRHIATAHTKNDQVETVLYRILRGTGIAGLSGIPSVRPINEAVSLIRPLLHTSRQEILGYLDRLEQPYRVDSSNLSTEFTRNRLRLELLPLLREQYNPNVDDALLRLAALASEVQPMLHEKTMVLREEAVCSATESEIVLDRTRLLRESPFQICELLGVLWEECGWSLRPMGFDQWRRMEQWIRDPQTPRLFLPGEIEMSVDLKKETVFWRTPGRPDMEKEKKWSGWS